MPSSITAAGVVFPDATVQTTAAGAGGSSLEAVASGSLSDGSTVVVNSDGTVSVVAGNAQVAGTPVVFETGLTVYISAAYDSANARVVVTCQDSGNSSYGTAVVGTVSGTSISFGTPVVFESASTTWTAATYHTAAQKIVVAYADVGNSTRGTAIVGTVSGTSISFGTAVVFETGFTDNVSISYDSTNAKIVVSYRDGGNSNYGTAAVGTVSGTSISFGTPVVFRSAAIREVASSYDSTLSKTIILTTDNDGSGFGRGVVGTVSGTSISFGSSATFNARYTQAPAAAYDVQNQKTVVAYNDFNNSLGGLVLGIVSGTSISFGSQITFNNSTSNSVSLSYDANVKKVVISYRSQGGSNYGTVNTGEIVGASVIFGTPTVFENADTSWIASTYESNANKTVIAYVDGGNSQRGTAVIFQPESTNLTATNYIGISDGAYTNGQTATVQLLGSVDDAQSGLTAGQKYYVTKSGTLSLTPDTPSVLAGTAVSATELIIKR